MVLKKGFSLGLLFVLSAVQVSAAEHFYGKYHLPEPPAVESTEFKLDYSELHFLQDTRTKEQCVAADAQSHFSFENTFGPSTGILTQAEFERARLLSYEVYAKIFPVFRYFKMHFGRARPYVADKTLTPCIRFPLKKDWSYPSGHSATGYAMALALAKKFPAQAILRLR